MSANIVDVTVTSHTREGISVDHQTGDEASDFVIFVTEQGLDFEAAARKLAADVVNETPWDEMNATPDPEWTVRVTIGPEDDITEQDEELFFFTLEDLTR